MWSIATIKMKTTRFLHLGNGGTSQITELRGRLISGTAWNSLATVFTQGSTFLANIFVARILLKQSFGEYAMVLSTLLMMATLSQLATGYTASKYVAEYRSSFPERSGRIMGLCFVVSVLTAGLATIMLLAIAPWLAATVLKAPHLTISLMIGAGFLFFSAINGYQTGALAGLEAYSGLAKAGVASGIVAVSTISAGGWVGGLKGALAGLSIGAFCRCLIHYRQLRQENRAQSIKIRYDGFGREKTVIIKFALPAAIAGYYSIPMVWLGNYVLVRQPGGYGEMALYAAALNIKSLVLFIPSVINNVVSSILNHIKGSGDQKQYDFLYRFNVFLIFSTSLLIAMIVSAFGKLVLGMFGSSFTAARAILLVVLVSSVLEATNSAIYQRIQNYGRIWLSFILLSLPLGPVFVITAFLIVPKLGALGLGIANVIMSILSLFGTGLIAYGLRRSENIRTRLEPVSKLHRES